MDQREGLPAVGYRSRAVERSGRWRVRARRVLADSTPLVGRAKSAGERAQGLARDYGEALLYVVGAALAQAMVWPHVAPTPYLLFDLAVLLASRRGWGPGLFSTAVSIVVIDFLFLGTPFRFTFSRSDLFSLVLFGAVGIAVTGINVSGLRARKAEEERLEQRVRDRTTELTAINHELETFAHSVSHDLRAPLRAIDGFAKALLRGPAGRLDEQGQHYLERIRAGTQRMGGLIDDLLRLSRLTRSPLVVEPLDLAVLAGVVVDELRRREPERRVEVAIHGPMPAFGDRRFLQIALENLIGNAWKFTSRCPTAHIEVGCLDSAGERVFYVQDNGVGFDMKYASKLFAPFQRLHATADFEGTGVGLATVHRVVARHGGRIWAESEVGAGATFFFTLTRHT